MNLKYFDFCKGDIYNNMFNFFLPSVKMEGYSPVLFPMLISVFLLVYICIFMFVGFVECALQELNFLSSLYFIAMAHDYLVIVKGDTKQKVEIVCRFYFLNILGNENLLCVTSFVRYLLDLMILDLV